MNWRVAILYGGGIFACRHCYGLNYDTQHEQAWDRALTRYQKIRVKLGAHAAIGHFPEKPKRDALAHLQTVGKEA